MSTQDLAPVGTRSIPAAEFDVMAFEDFERVSTHRAENLPQALGMAVGLMIELWGVPTSDIEIVTPVTGQEFRFTDGAHRRAFQEGHMVTIRKGAVSQPTGAPETLGPFDTKLWAAELRTTGRTATFLARPGVTETYEYTLHDWEGVVYEWDVAALQARANGRQIVMEAVAPLIEIVMAGQVEVCRDRVMTDPSINIDVPLLVLPLPFPSVENGEAIHIVVDGWHRLVRAWAAGRTEVGLVILSREDEAACRLKPSLNELAAILLPQIARRNAARDEAGQRRDGAYVTADDGDLEMLAIGVCDFCRSNGLSWCYPANSFELASMQWRSVGNWGACEPCAALIEAVDLDGLAGRCTDKLVEEQGEEIREQSLTWMRTLHSAFITNGAGPRHPQHEVPLGGLEGPHDAAP